MLALAGENQRQAAVDVDATAPHVKNKFFGAFVPANKPKTACCQSGYCTPALSGAKE
jgi:hypothetical protein